MADKLDKVRKKFAERVSIPTLDRLLDNILEDRIVNDWQKSILEGNSSRENKARCLIDTVKRKGDKASRMMIAHLQNCDPFLYSELGLGPLTPAPPAAEPQSMKEEGWSTTLIPTTEDFWREKQNKKEIYPVTKDNYRNRVALLITNIKFKLKRLDRHGADKDEENAEKLLTDLGYEVVKYTNLTAKAIDDAVIKFSKHQKLRETDSVMVVIMSHGKLGIILGVETSAPEPDEFPIDNIYKHLGPEKCPALLNKPKILIIQGCRGGEEGSVLVSDSAAVPDLLRMKGNSPEDIKDDSCQRIEHREKDFISLLSCTPGTVAYRHKALGSLLIRFTVHVFNTFAYQDDIEELFRKVMLRFEEDCSSNIWQMATKDRCTLTKRFYFYPGAVMGALLEEIQIMSPKAADALKQAGFKTDSDIQSLTREDLHDLLPGAKDFKLRKDVFEMIQKSRSPNMLLKELIELQNNSATCAFMGDLLKEIQIMSPKAADALKQAGFESVSDFQSLTREDLLDLLPGAGDFKLRKDVFEMIQKSRPPNMLLKELGELQYNSATCAVMGDLLKEIQIMSPEAADALKQEGFVMDSDIQSLTREDLTQLLPGVENLRLRKDVYETIQKSRPANKPLEELGELLKNLASSAQVDSEVIKQKFDLIIEILVKMQADSKADKATVKYKMVVGGQTFGAHTQLMDQVNRATKGDVRLLENSQDSQIIIVFCPITSRVESDVKAAMTGVPGDKPVILVKMHHVCESKSSLCFNTWIDDRNIVLQVNVFYHENLSGLLHCQLNDTAVYDIKQALLKHSVHKSQVTRASTSGQGPSSSRITDRHPWMWGSEAQQLGRGGTTGGPNARTSAHNSQEVTVKYKMVVGGKTFGAHTQLMDQVNHATRGNVRLLENSQDSQIIFVFCPITSRVESDVKAAMTGVPGDKPVILVKMHHVCESKSTLCFNTSIDDRNDVLQVNVFYHENIRGLLECPLNNKAVYEIQHELLKHSVHRSTETRASTSGQDPKKAKKNKNIFGR